MRICDVYSELLHLRCGDILDIDFLRRSSLSKKHYKWNVIRPSEFLPEHLSVSPLRLDLSSSEVLGNAKGAVAVVVSILIFRNPVSVTGMLGYALLVASKLRARGGV
ncbi:UDP-URONIC ACID TRANSPORTER 1-like [Tasmannia lanceolata]|uniref:UDP-URONIC ACID TRANSPORTER 1-like n=1 Tax=Tasmannia lanceolata TaxID=3420 RepID=UPI004063C709